MILLPTGSSREKSVVLKDSETMRFSHLQSASAVLRISGPDANTFLNGQFTQELRISPGQFAYGLWLNQKGKVLADSHVLRISAEEHLVFGAEADVAALRQRLEDYLIADEVNVADESGQWSATLAWGQGAAAALASLFGSEVGAGGFVRAGEAFAFAANGQIDRFWIFYPHHGAAEWRARLAAAGTEVHAVTAARDRIVARVPAVPADIGPEDLPNEGGLDATAIAFTKGCYLGQEVMSRLKNLGQVRRRLHVVRGPGEVPLAKTALFQGEKRVGETRSAARDGDRFVAFAMLSLVNLNPQAPLQLGQGGAPVEIVRHG
ncbi:MAG: folate-binding protein [Opitutus sp.]|nr:folate-binding protein [Opitutus sp.]